MVTSYYKWQNHGCKSSVNLRIFSKNIIVQFSISVKKSFQCVYKHIWMIVWVSYSLSEVCFTPLGHSTPHVTEQLSHLWPSWHLCLHTFIFFYRNNSFCRTAKTFLQKFRKFNLQSSVKKNFLTCTHENITLESKANSLGLVVPKDHV